MAPGGEARTPRLAPLAGAASPDGRLDSRSAVAGHHQPSVSVQDEENKAAHYEKDAEREHRSAA